MSKLLAIVVALFAATWFATPAFATGPTDPHAYLQVCKVASPTLSGHFMFKVDGRDALYSVAPGTCTEQINVDGLTSVTVKEVAHPWFKISSIDYRDANGELHTFAAAAIPAYDWDASYYSFDIPVTRGDRFDTTVVHVANDPVMGSIEICKHAQNTTNASGTFMFKITSDVPTTVQESLVPTQDNLIGWIENLPAPANVPVNVGSCSGPIAVPAGDLVVTELATNGYRFVTDIDVSPNFRLYDSSVNLDAGTVRVHVRAAAEKLGETGINYTNSLSTLKVCKSAHDRLAAALAPYSFTATGGPAFQLTPTVSQPQCHEVGQMPPGAAVTVTEAVMPGTAVDRISLNNSHVLTDKVHFGFNIDPESQPVDTVSEATRTVTFYLRPGMNEVTFDNDPAFSVPLKVCKLPGTLTGTYSFATSGLTGYVSPFLGQLPPENMPGDDRTDIAAARTAFTVLPGQCTLVGYFPYDGTITITEAAGNLHAVTIDPLSVAATLVGTPNLTARSAAVLLGNYDYWRDGIHLLPAVVDFTNDPAAIVVNTNTNTNPGSTPVVLDTTQPALATIVSTTPPTKVATAAKVLKVASAKIVSVGKVRYVVVRVNGTAKTARIHVTLIQKNHKVVGSVTRYVATNKAVRVGNLKLVPSIISVRVAL